MEVTDAADTPRRWLMPTLDLTAEESEILRAVLESYLSDLRMEIAGTDSADFREKLKKKKALLTKIIPDLAGQPV